MVSSGPGSAAGPAPHAVGFVLLPRFGMLAFASGVEVLRQANRLGQRELYRWQVLSPSGGDVTCSAEVPVRTLALEAPGPLDLVMVVSGSSRPHVDEERLHAWLRRQGGRGCRLGGVSLGSYVLARAGLLDGYRCTVHWENLEPFREQFPQLQVTPEVCELDRDRLTCSGGTGALDLMLNYVAARNGGALARAVADVYILDRIREQNSPQRMPLRTRLGVSHPKLLAAITIIEQDAAPGCSKAELAARVGLSSRQLERLFRKYLKTTPRAYHLQCRLQRARNLLRQTSMEIIDVALACGFGTASHFTKTYREHYGVTPGVDRGDGP